MKVLTLREPYATLLREGIKHTETRSWKTSYRGELYIHTGAAKVPTSYENQDFEAIVRRFNYSSYGMITCKCKLIDCVEMTEEYIEQMKRDHYEDYLSGLYAPGRYAWILDEVEPIEPIVAKGKLSIWTFEPEDTAPSVI